MKITGIDIGEYRQFKNIKFDFTYPADHPKAGQPLEKVCFIGQSGTGKTTLLNVIWDFFQVFVDSYHRVALDNIPVKDEAYITFEEIKVHAIYDEQKITLDYDELKDILDHLDLDAKSKYANLGYHWLKGLGIYNSLKDQEKTKKLCLYIKDSISREANAFLFDQKDHPQTFSDFVKTDIQVEKEKIAYEQRIDEAGSKKAISLGDLQSLSIWQYLLKEIIEYDETTVTKIKNIVQNTSKNKFQEELQKWLQSDPRHELAEKCLNPILNKFFLELETNAGNVPITLRTAGGIKIDSSYLSTGTRQLLATAIPLYKFDTTDTVILFDEPERSLFPDIQQELVKYYTSLAPEAQFFFATHSPFVASAFEPCERFILYFDENGEVKCKSGVAPIGDDPNDILSEDFGLNELMLDEGLAAYEEYRNLGVAVRNETDPVRKNELITKRAKLGDNYKF
ncbi:AAA family ATPase [Spirosoma spitsbergense]|uniref:AAA family ATPase n=1 Tax=Spirosoma spitsbergense TaxID=431554 RepID=UPI0003719910|nr:AAA family ATPase [Spirosoma spitsbergense]